MLQGSPARGAAAAAMDSSMAQKVVETASIQTVKTAKKRKIEEEGGAKQAASPKKLKSEEVPAAQPQVATETPTEISHIAVPPVDLAGGRKVGANYMLPTTALNTSTLDIFPKDEDVLFGRGGRTNHHPGNKRLREIVLKYRHIYNQAKKVDKPKVSKLIVNALRGANPPSRFLRMNDETARWEDVGDKRAAEKVSQNLREKDRDEKAEYLARKTQADSMEAHAAAASHAAAAAVDAASQAAPEEAAVHVVAHAAAHEEGMAASEEVQVQAPLPSPGKPEEVEI